MVLEGWSDGGFDAWRNQLMIGVPEGGGEGRRGEEERQEERGEGETGKEEVALIGK